MKWKFLLLGLCYIPGAVFANEARHYYIIRKGECITNALYQAGLEPMYGKRGFLLDIKQENPNIENLDHVRPGQKIFFPKNLALRAESLGYVQITPTKQVVLVGSQTAILEKPLSSIEKRRPAQQTQDSVEPVISVAKAETKPAPVPVVAYAPSPDIQSRLEFSVGTGYSRIDSRFTDSAASAKVLSKPAFNTDMKWEHIWSESLESLIHWSYEAIPYLDANQGILYNAKPSKSLFGLGLKNKISSQLWLISEVGSREEIFAPSYTAGTSTLETSSLLFLKLGVQKDLLRVRALKLTGGVAAAYLMGESGGSYDIKSGMAYSGLLKFSQKLKSFTFFAEGEYVQTSQNTSQAQQLTRDLKSRLGVSIPLESGENP